MIMVHCKNGEKIQIPNGSKVEAEKFPGLNESGFVVKSDDGKLLGHFITSELVGYTILPEITYGALPR